MKVKVGNRLVGEDEPCFIVADIGINHNGSLETARQLITKASIAGCDAVKFQKRTIDLVYTKEDLDRPRESPFGTTNRALKEGLELDEHEYREIDYYCKKLGIVWFASCWDTGSVDFMEQFNLPCYKIASPCLTDDKLLLHTKSKGRPIILSTGMSTLKQIRHATDVLVSDYILLHCTSTYPGKVEELNLNVIPFLKKTYSCPIGYSGHEVGISTTIAAAVLGAKMVERHWDGISSFIQLEDKVSLGFVEGLNNKIRVIQRRAYGLRDEEYLRLKVLTCMLPPI